MDDRVKRPDETGSDNSPPPLDSRAAPPDPPPLPPPLDDAELAARKVEIERQIQWELQSQEAREASLQGAQAFQTGGALRGLPSRQGIGNFEMVRNGNWDAALNGAFDGFGVLGELPGLLQDLNTLSVLQAQSRIQELRERMVQAGVKNLPNDYEHGIVAGGAMVHNYQKTVARLGEIYEDHIRDLRLRQTWGDDYQSLRVGKSQMTVQQFEKRVLDVHLSATDTAYATGIELIAKGKLKVKPDEYARELGNFIDKQVRDQLRGFAHIEGIYAGPMSNLLAINRRIKNEFNIGVPDNRLGFNLYAHTTLARKNAFTPQIMKWNEIRSGSFMIIRPSILGGPYAIPRVLIQIQSKPIGRGI